MPTLLRTALVWSWVLLTPLAALAQTQTDVRAPKAAPQGLAAILCVVVLVATVVLWVVATRYRGRHAGG